MCTVKQLAEACHVTANTEGERSITYASYVRDKSPGITQCITPWSTLLLIAEVFLFIICNVKLSTFLTCININVIVKSGTVHCEILNGDYRDLHYERFR
jgi:hypothetical protein